MSDDPNAPWAKRPLYLQRFFDPSVNRERIYYRRKGAPRKVELASPWGTQALADEVGAIDKSFKPRPRPNAGTIVAAIREYRGDSARRIAPSADFISLAFTTQKEYERTLDEFEITFAGMLLSDVDAGYVLALRDGWAQRGHRAANVRLQILKNVCKAPRIRGEIAGNPFELIDKVPRPQSLGVANPRWLDDEFAAVLEHALETKRPGHARALALGRWGGFRAQTIRSVPRKARIERVNEDGVMERRLYWVTEKKLVLCDRREDPRLTALLARTQNMCARFGANVEPLTIAYNSYGQPWQKRALNHAVDALVASVAEKGLCRPDLTIHGLRHSRGVELAMAGSSDAQIMSQLDHATPRQAALYRRQAERLGLADDAQDKVDARIVKLAARRAARAAEDGE